MHLRDIAPTLLHKGATYTAFELQQIILRTKTHSSTLPPQVQSRPACQLCAFPPRPTANKWHINFLVRIRKLSHIDFAMSVCPFYSSPVELRHVFGLWPARFRCPGIEVFTSLQGKNHPNCQPRGPGNASRSGVGSRAQNYRGTGVSMQLAREPRYWSCGIYHATGLLKSGDTHTTPLNTKTITKSLHAFMHLSQVQLLNI